MKTTEELASDIAACAKAEDAAKLRFDAAVKEWAAAKQELDAAHHATNQAIMALRERSEDGRPKVVKADEEPTFLDKVHSFLEQRGGVGATCGEVHDALGAGKRSNTSAALFALVYQGRAVKVRRGVYAANMGAS